MNRRELFGLCGSAGVGLTLAGVSGAADPHKDDGKGGPLHAGHAHFCGIHIVKADPKVQFIVQHFLRRSHRRRHRRTNVPVHPVRLHRQERQAARR